MLNFKLALSQNQKYMIVIVNFKTKNYQIYILGQLILTRNLKIKLVVKINLRFFLRQKKREK